MKHILTALILLLPLPAQANPLKMYVLGVYDFIILSTVCKPNPDFAGAQRGTVAEIVLQRSAPLMKALQSRMPNSGYGMPPSSYAMIITTVRTLCTNHETLLRGVFHLRQNLLTKQ